VADLGGREGQGRGEEVVTGSPRYSDFAQRIPTFALRVAGA